MGLLSKILRNGSDNGLTWWCPGCNQAHQIRHGEGPGPRWGWNGNAEAPTFTPSVLVRYPANPDAAEEFKEWRSERVCHSFVVEGQMQFLGDCTHALANQTVPIPAWPIADWRDG
jgi:hypothetical protein